MRIIYSRLVQNESLKEKKHTILIFFSIVFDNLSVLILSDFFKYFRSQFHFSKSQIGSNSVSKRVLLRLTVSRKTATKFNC